MAKINLTEEQKAIVSLETGQHLVLAPPGTGKTELLAHRVLNGLSSGQDPKKMICLTFTNRAAKGMKLRIAETSSDHGVFIGNIHNFSAKFLFTNKLIPQITALMDEEDSNLLIEEAKELCHLSYDEITNYDLLQTNNYLKQVNHKFPQDLLLLPQKKYYHDPNVIEVCQSYETLKMESNLFDFDDLLTNTFLFLSGNKTDYELSKYEWIQVDEVQDLNPLQWRIVQLLGTEKSLRVYFGDYEQAIFSFMGARLAKLHQIAQESQVHNLQKNFRSPSYLLNIYIDFAKILLNPGWKKDPIPDQIRATAPDSLQLISIQGNNFTEINYITTKIIPPLLKKTEERTAILVRWNKQADEISESLNRLSIDNFKISGFDLFRRKIIKDVMAFLSLLDNSKDKMSWIRIFTIFGKIPTLKESRQVINSLFKAGLLPEDILNENDSKSSSLQAFLNDYKNERIVVFDTETTGLDKKNDDIIQIAAIEIINGHICKEFQIYLKTSKSLENTAILNGISNAYLATNGKNRKEAFAEFLNFVGKNVLVAHNLKYDLTILKNNLFREGINQSAPNFENCFDTLELSRRAFPLLNSYKLKDLITALQLAGSNTHNAIDDVRATVQLVTKIIQTAEQNQLIIHDLRVKHQTIIKNLTNNFSPFWFAIKSRKKEIINFSSLINQFLDYTIQKMNYKYSKEDELHLGRLIRHMDFYCGVKEMRYLLNNHMSEYRVFKEPDLLIGNEKIIISTVHKAKGLEFENVIIPSCSEGVYPMRREVTQEDITESAKTLYVALTRAMKRLIITYTNSPSRFLSSISKHFRTNQLNGNK